MELWVFIQLDLLPSPHSIMDLYILVLQSIPQCVYYLYLLITAAQCRQQPNNIQHQVLILWMNQPVGVFGGSEPKTSQFQDGHLYH